MSALYDGRIEERHLDGGATYQLTLHYRADGKDYSARRTWRHNHASEYGTRPALHSRDSMKWACAFDIDKQVEEDRAARAAQPPANDSSHGRLA
jgi:hypothetical protein